MWAGEEGIEGVGNGGAESGAVGGFLNDSAGQRSVRAPMTA